ncbi:Bro-N domain-containing protein [Candidatus Uhrbacteria bacterium]|nr:Bro-N domain-containing protein [Candidatus Uhrbacteria bacterium]
MPSKKNSSNNSSKFIVLFEDHPVRRAWVEKEDKWYFAIVDVIRILTDSADPAGYLKDMRRRDVELSKGWGQIATPLSVETKGGRQKVNCANVEGILRIVQSIPSPKAEPFKLWLAKVGYERLQETVDPELAVNRARKNWKILGRSEKWIEGRMRGQEVRNKLTDYWNEHGVKEGIEYAKLTNVIHKEWSGITTGQHKQVKGLRKGDNLRNNMTEAELIFTALAELSTTQIAITDQADGYKKNEQAAKKGGSIARGARQQLEQQTGKRVVSPDNFLPEDQQNKRKKLK